MQKAILALISLAVIGVGGYLFMQHSFVPSSQNGEPVGIVCTQEAMLCPDGVTYVGRTGPHCAFAECPAASNASTSPARLTAQINKKVSALGVSITVLEVVEDSRCPVDVQCIQAGNVRVKAIIESGMGASTVTLGLQTPLTTEAERITLVQVMPTANSKKEIKPAEYIFTFSIEKR